MIEFDFVNRPAMWLFYWQVDSVIRYNKKYRQEEETIQLLLLAVLLTISHILFILYNNIHISRAIISRQSIRMICLPNGSYYLLLFKNVFRNNRWQQTLSMYAARSANCSELERAVDNSIRSKHSFCFRTSVENNSIMKWLFFVHNSMYSASFPIPRISAEKWERPWMYFN